MQVVNIDLKKSPDIANWAVDKEPGDAVCLYGTIKAKDDQTLTITVSEVDEKEPKADDENEEPGNEGSGDVVADEMEDDDEV